MRRYSVSYLIGSSWLLQPPRRARSAPQARFVCSTSRSTSASPSLGMKEGRGVQQRMSSQSATRKPGDLEALVKSLEVRLGLPLSDRSAWYAVTPAQVLENGGLELLRRFHDSLHLLLKAVYPEHNWEDSRFPSQTSSSDLWSDPGNVRAAMISIGKNLRINPLAFESWYSISTSRLREAGAAFLLSNIGPRSRLLEVSFPEHKWDPLRFTTKESSNKRPRESLRSALERVASELGIAADDYEAWYKVKNGELLRRGLPLARKSSAEFFSEVFPDHNWSPHRFAFSHSFDVIKAPLEDLKRLAKDLEDLLGITSPEGWYNVPKETLYSHRLAQFFPYQAHLICLLQNVYPSFDWNSGRFLFGAQGFGSLFSNLVSLFDREVEMGPRFFSRTLSLNLRKRDVAKTLIIPSIRLIFDYQGPTYYARPLLEKRDELVLELRPALSIWAAENGFTLVTVPFWFDRSKAAVLKEIHSHRQDLFADNGHLARHLAIALSAPSNPHSIPRSDLALNPTYLKLWREDERFHEYAFSEMATKRKKRKPSKKEAKPPVISGRRQLKAAVLEVFEREENPGRAQREEIASKLGVRRKRIDDWFRRLRLQRKEGEIFTG